MFPFPAGGTKVTSTTTVRLDLGQWTDADLVQRCPSEKDTTYKFPANDPDYDSDSTTSDSGSTSGGNVGTVHPGSFCSPRGVINVTEAGTPWSAARF